MCEGLSEFMTPKVRPWDGPSVCSLTVLPEGTEGCSTLIDCFGTVFGYVFIGVRNVEKRKRSHEAREEKEQTKGENIINNIISKKRNKIIQNMREVGRSTNDTRQEHLGAKRSDHKRKY